MRIAQTLPCILVLLSTVWLSARTWAEEGSLETTLIDVANHYREKRQLGYPPAGQLTKESIPYLKKVALDDAAPVEQRYVALWFLQLCSTEAKAVVPEIYELARKPETVRELKHSAAGVLISTGYIKETVARARDEARTLDERRAALALIENIAAGDIFDGRALIEIFVSNADPEMRRSITHIPYLETPPDFNAMTPLGEIFMDAKLPDEFRIFALQQMCKQAIRKPNAVDHGQKVVRLTSQSIEDPQCSVAVREAAFSQFIQFARGGDALEKNLRRWMNDKNCLTSARGEAITHFLYRTEDAAARSEAILVAVEFIVDPNTHEKLRESASASFAYCTDTYAKQPAQLDLRAKMAKEIEASIPRLAAALKSPKDEIRTAAFHALRVSTWDTELMLPALMDLAQTEPQTRLRAQALELLPLYESSEATVAVMLRAVSDPNADVRFNGLQGLLWLNKVEEIPIPVLLELLENAPSQSLSPSRRQGRGCDRRGTTVRSVVAAALCKLGPKVKEFLPRIRAVFLRADVSGEERIPVAYVLIVIGGVDSCAELFKMNDAEMVIPLLYALYTNPAVTENQAVLRHTLGLMNHADENVRNVAAGLMHKIIMQFAHQSRTAPPTESYDFLLSYIADRRNPAVMRGNAIQAFHLSGPECIPALIGLLDDSAVVERVGGNTVTVQAKAALALYLTSEWMPAVVPVLLPLLKSPHWQTRNNAILALSTHGGRRAEVLAGVRPLLTDPNDEVRAAAALKLRVFGESTDECNRVLVAILKQDPSERTRMRVLWGLPDAGVVTPELLKAAQDALNDVDDSVRKAAEYAASSLEHSVDPARWLEDLANYRRAIFQ